MIEFKQFDNGDWQCFSGAESFADGSAPLTAYLDVDGLPAQVVIDRAGMSVMWENEAEQRSYEMGFEGTDGMRAVAMLHVEMTTAELRALGGKLR